MAAPLPPPGWYPDPSGAPGQRYFDGRDWTQHQASPPMVMPPQPPPVARVVVTGPNHGLHAVATLLTFWACGGWAWVWLFVALSNNRQMQTIDAYGNIIRRSGPTAAQRDKQIENWMMWGGMALLGVVMLAIIVVAVLR